MRSRRTEREGDREEGGIGIEVRVGVRMGEKE